MARTVLRYAAFTDDPAGGNPAGVVLGAEGMSDEEMLAVAADVGYSETAFLADTGTDRTYDVRYFSPLVEIPFCGHATIASGVVLAGRDGAGQVLFNTMSGPVPVSTEVDAGGLTAATLTSVPAHVEEVAAGTLQEALDCLGWSPGDLDPALPPRVGFAGAYHLILAAGTRERLAALDYDFDRLGSLMRARDWITVQLVWRENGSLFHARDPFPVGGVVEDPATGAAAAAFGAYLRDLGLIAPPARVTILQGEDMGRPGRLLVDIPAGRPEISVTGTAVEISP